MQDSFLKKFFLNVKVLNAVIFQTIWWSVLILQSQKQTYWVFAVGLFGALAQLLLCQKSKLYFLMLWSLLATLGFCFDLLCSKLGWIQFENNQIPWWLLPVWFQMASGLSLSMSLFANQPRTAFVLGAVFGPLSYYGASLWNVFAYNSERQSVFAHSLCWGLLFVFLLKLAKRGNKIHG